jgi:MFS family permease
VSAGAMNFLLSCTAAPCVTLAIGAVAPSDRGLAATLMLVFSGLLGGALGPFVVGVISDLATSGQDAQGLRYGLSFLLLVPVLSTIALLLALRQLSSKHRADAVIEGTAN